MRNPALCALASLAALAAGCREGPADPCLDAFEDCCEEAGGHYDPADATCFTTSPEQEEGACGCLVDAGCGDLC